MSDSDEFFQKFEGYVIPRKKKSSDNEVSPDVEVIDDKSEVSVLRPDENTKRKSSPSKSKFRKVSKRSASTFLQDSDDEHGIPIFGLKDPLGLEKVMTYGEARGNRHSALEVFLSLFEEPLPDDIVRQSTDKECRLCSVNFDNNITAKSHYAGKNHLKKVKRALEEWHQRDPTKNIIPGMKQTEVSSTNTNESMSFYENREDHDETYCNICRIELSSKIVATSHYQGKNHAKQLRKVQNGTYVPKEKGFPSLPKKPKVTNIQDVVLPDRESRQGSGNRFMCMQCKLHFQSNEQFIKHLSSPDHKKNGEEGGKGGQFDVVEFSTPPSQDSIDDMLTKLRANPQSAFDCTLCQVQCSSQATLTTHLSGKQHKKKLEMSYCGGGSMFKCDICNVETTDQNGLDMHIAGKKHQKKLNASKGIPSAFVN